MHGLDEHFEETKRRLAGRMDEYHLIQKNLVEGIKNDIFGETAKFFFEKHPEIKKIYWTAATPYWNDGEECVFSVNEIHYAVDRGDDEVDYEDYEGDELPDLSRVERNEADIELLDRAIRDYRVGSVDSEAVRGVMNGNLSWYASTSEREGRWPNETRAITFSVTKAITKLEKLRNEVRSDRELLAKFKNAEGTRGAVRSFIELIESIDSEVMKEVFGDHVRVELDRNGVHVEEYTDHE